MTLNNNCYENEREGRRRREGQQEGRQEDHLTQMLRDFGFLLYRTKHCSLPAVVEANVHHCYYY